MIKINIVLLEPEIPFNTGNIGRTCAATDAALHLIRPLGFSTDDKYLRRSGMDYWKSLDVRYYDSFDDFLTQNGHPRPYMATTKARHSYADAAYQDGCFIMFGKESQGIPEEILLSYPDTAIRIPMRPNTRSLNLSNAVAVVLYEALRQQDFAGLESQGQLHRHHW